MTVPLLTMSVPFALVELPTIRRLLLTANVPPATTMVAVLPLPLAIHVCIVGTIIEPPLVRIVVPALNRFCMVKADPLARRLLPLTTHVPVPFFVSAIRSEERRVGKECRLRCPTDA